ncbi:MAG: hypothetical protein ACI4HO_02065 [Ruminococcus sp.]
MAKYEVKMACGHTRTVELFGKTSDRERKIKWLEENGICPDCKAKENAQDCEEIEMLYGEYKKNYSDCKTKPNSYNAKTKTIVVFVPIAEPIEEIVDCKETHPEKEAINEMCKIFEVKKSDNNYNNFVSFCKKALTCTLEENERAMLKEAEKCNSSDKAEKIEKAKKIISIIKKYKEAIK